MKEIIKKLIKYMIPGRIMYLFEKSLSKRRIRKWNESGCPAPPPHIIKQNIIAEYQQQYGYSVLLETGTYLGEMVQAQKKRFKRIISIELGVDLYNRAVKKFRKDNNIEIVHGDSGKVLPLVLKGINEPIIFWLDGHYSEGVTAKGEKNCPIFEEIDAIFNSVKFDHVILIDDARYFIGEGDYPTINELTEYVKSKDDRYKAIVKHDIIRYVI